MKYSALFALFFLFACTEEHKIKPLSTGKLGELFVMVDDDLNTPALKSTLREALEKPADIVAGTEPYFKLIFVSPGQMKGKLVYDGTLLVLTKTGPTSEVLPLLPDELDSFVVNAEAGAVQTYLKKDIWSTPQSALFLLGNRTDSLIGYIKEKEAALLEKLLDLERQEATTKLTRIPEEKVRKPVLDSHQIDIRIPATYHIALNKKINDTEGLVWLRNEGSDFDLNVVVHYQPYKDTSQLLLSNLIARRDSVEKPIGGEAEGSAMSTDTQFKMNLETTTFNGMFAREYMGWWTLKNDFMGGPFYSITVVDEKRNRLITMEGFVYAPDKKKTSYVRELKGIIHGIRF